MTADLGTNFDPAKFQSVTAALTDGPAGFAVYDALVVVDPNTLAALPQVAT